MWISEVLTFIAISVIVAFLWKWKKFIQVANKIPKSSFDSSFSNLYEILHADTKRFYFEVTQALKIGGMTRTWFGPLLIIGVVTPEDVKIVMNSKDCVDKPSFVKKSFNLPQGSLFGHIKPWKLHRKIVNPYFTVMSLRSLMPLFNGRVQVMMSNLKKVEDNGEFNVFHYSAALTLETILSVMEFNVDIQSLEREKRDSFVVNLETFMETSNYRMIKLWLHPDFIFKRSVLGKRQAEARSNSAFAFTPAIMRQTREALTEDDDERPKNFVRALMDPKNALSDAEISDEIDTLLLAAQETTAITSSATLLLLAMHKDEQNKVLDELRRVVGTASFLDIEMLNELEYLEMAINETMRLIPTLPLVFRINERDIISSEGYTVPAGTNLVVPVFYVHKNKETWGEDADEFRPERFAKENISKIHPYAFLPFSRGSRMCIGWRYAMFLMKIQLANILLMYEVDTSLKLEELDFKMNITIDLCQGYRISIKKRNF